MSKTTPTPEPPWAACLTPPGAGGVAVIQMVGPVENLARFLSPADLAALEAGGADRFRLCRWVEGDEALDEVVVTSRSRSDTCRVTELCLHGGPRIVQRVLLQLRRAGVEIVEPATVLAESWPPRDRFEAEVLEALLTARTRAVAAWLVRMGEQVPAAFARLAERIEAGETADCRTRLTEMIDRGESTKALCRGVRVVLVGEPNVGKSTLANALAQRDRAVVSDQPGTTRDWVEHPGAIDGIPFAFVDTAGLRVSDDPLEVESMRRSRGQVATADVVVRLIDGSVVPPGAMRRVVDRLASDPPASPRWAEIVVWTKSDLPLHPEQRGWLESVGRSGMMLAARTGDRLDELRSRLVEAVGLTAWRRFGPTPFNPRQLGACQAALSALQTDPPAAAVALAGLRSAL